ncbi:cellulose synthase complex outer membrane protein BcsC [Zobellella sp. DQSA1]|uniref:cellulose synthase complex outer membrane protein BcsC n=1 Tax=Zobellella sp. DQSA1 TaxID=3342386 RepID=UPI0035C2472E
MRIVPFFSVCLLLHGSLVLARPDSPEQQQEWLLEQLRMGQALYRDDIVQDALGRLELVAPHHPEVVLTGIEFSLERGERGRAQALLQGWLKQGADPAAVRQAQALLRIYDEEGHQQLQQARLLSASGQVEQAMELYRNLWGEQPPGLTLGLEHWRTLASLEGQRLPAIRRLGQMERQYPGNPEIRLTLARLLLAEERPEEALALLDDLARNPNAANRAAELEYNYLVELPVSDETSRLWQRFLRRYDGTGYHQGAERQWQQQRTLLADPAWRAGEQGKALVAAQQYQRAQALLRRALGRYPEDAGLHGALGQALIQLKQYPQAVRSLAEAERLEQDGTYISKWQDLRVYGQSLVWLQRGDDALARGEHQLARQAYRQAIHIRPNDVDGLLGQYQVALAEGDEVAAERWLNRARQRDPENGKLVYALVGFYRERAPEQAEAVLAGLSPASRRMFSDLATSLRLERLEREARAALAREDRAQATLLLREAIELGPDRPWLSYQLAGLLQERGQAKEAEDIFRQLLRRQGQNPEARHAHGLYLAAQDRDEESLATLAAIEREKWSPAMEELASRVEGQQRRASALALRERGDVAAGRALLSQDGSLEDRLLLADWWLQDGAYEEAIDYYRQLESEPTTNTDARLGLAESYVALDNPAAAKLWLPIELPDNASINQRRRYINLLAELGDRGRAAMLMNKLVADAPADSLLLRDAARLQEDPAQALSLYARGLAAANLLAPGYLIPRDDAALTMATRSREDDDWLASSLKAETADLYRRQNPSVQLQHNTGWRTDNNPSGVADLSLQTTLLRAEVPREQGRVWLQAEQVWLDAGKPEARDRFGACNATLNGCTFGKMDASGTGLAMGWDDERWSWDLGHSPLGFEVGNWLGGGSYRDSWGPLGYRLTLSRRPMSNSLVSYAGAVDPVTGLSWGGVTATGLTLGLSHDQGGADGIWASLGTHYLDGKRVEDNFRFSAMGGYYYRLINNLDEQLRLGSSLMYWRYDKDLSENTLGQGGYYSPQNYVSVGLPVGYARRGEDWSVTLDASLGWSYSRSEGHVLYPGHEQQIANSGLAPAPGAARASGADSSSGPGGRIAGQGEYRLTDHWILGGGLSWQVSSGYAPGNAFVYLRYHLNPWRGKLDFPVEPLAPYADWR